MVGSNWGGSRRKNRHWSGQITRKAAIQIAVEADEETLRNVDERWGCSWHASGAPAIVWSLDHAQLEVSNHYSTPGARGGSHGVTAHAVTLCLHRGPEDSKLLGIAGVHINNIMAKQSPTRVLSELQDLEKWLLLMNIDVALVDANQCAFSRDGRPATLGQVFHAPVWQEPPTGVMWGIAPQVAQEACLGFLVRQRSFSPLQITSHGTWNAEADDLELSQKDKGWHRPVFLVIQQGRHGTGWAGTEPPVPKWPAGKGSERRRKRGNESVHMTFLLRHLCQHTQTSQDNDHETSEGQTGDIDAVEEGAADAAPQEQQPEYYRWTWGQETGWTEIPASSRQLTSQGDGGGAAHAAPSQFCPLPFFSSSPSRKRHMEWMDSMEHSTTAACVD